MVDWLDILAPPIEAVEHGIQQHTETFQSIYVGPRSFDRIEYPVGEVLPQDVARQSGNHWTHTIYANLYFERGRDADYFEDVLHPTSAVISDCLAALSDEPAVVTYVPNRVESFAGELDDTLVVLISVEFEVQVEVGIATT